jgi:maltose O-acetyltransferase
MSRALDTMMTMAEKDVKNTGLYAKRTLIGIISNSLGNSYVMQTLRGQVLRLAGARVAPGTRIRSPVYVENPGNLAIDRGSFVNKELYLDNGGAGVTIGKNVIIGFRVSMTTSNHDFLTQDPVNEPITIEDDVWIGACSTILPGVTVGRGAVIASGAVVAGDVSPYTVVGGIPARTIKNIELAELAEMQAITSRQHCSR